MEKGKRFKPSFKELYEIMLNKGITFNNMTKDEVIDMLRSRNYYYKLTVYKRNFRRDDDKCFINLDFNYLIELARIDMELRSLFNHLTLDIEHALKTYFVASITDNPKEDGYKIVNSFFHSENSKSNGLTKNLLFEKISRENSYQYNLYKKHKDYPSAWVLVEVMSFGDFLRLFEFYFRKYPSSEFQISSLMGVLMSVKRIRNLSAHNVPFLFDINEMKLQRPSNYIQNYSKNLGYGEMFYRCPKVHDALSVFWIHQKFINGSRTVKKRYAEFEALNELSNPTLEKLDKENDLIYFFQVIKKAVDAYNN